MQLYLRTSYQTTLYHIILHSRVELSTVVMELGCPVPGLGGADSLTDPNNRTAVLHYLVHELMSLRLAATTVTQTKQVQVNSIVTVEEKLSINLIKFRKIVIDGNL